MRREIEDEANERRTELLLDRLALRPVPRSDALAAAATAPPPPPPPPPAVVTVSPDQTKYYSRALSYDVTQALAVWAVPDLRAETAGTPQDMRAQLCDLLALAVLDFQRPDGRRSAWTTAFGGVLRVVWDRGDAAPRERTARKGAVVRVLDIRVLPTGSMPMAEASCEVRHA